MTNDERSTGENVEIEDDESKTRLSTPSTKENPMHESALKTIANNRSALAAFEEEGRSALAGLTTFLKFTKQGEWIWGTEENEVEDTEELAVNMATYAKGCICWDDGNPIDEVMEFVASGREVSKSDLKDHGVEIGDGDGWKEQRAVDLKILPDGTELHFATTSKGGRYALSDLARRFASRVKAGEKDLVPVVQLSGGSYEHKRYGTIATPVIEITRWTNEEALSSAGLDIANEDDPLPGVEEQEAPAAESKTQKRSKSAAGDDQGQRKLSS
jgi:hypothetical protein